MRSMASLFFALFVCGYAYEAEVEGPTGNDDVQYKWVGVFDFDAENYYSWRAEMNDEGKYSPSALVFSLHALEGHQDDHDHEEEDHDYQKDIDGIKGTVTEMWKNKSTFLHKHDDYRMKWTASKPLNNFTMDWHFTSFTYENKMLFKGLNHTVAIFASHNPNDLLNDGKHFLLDKSGKDVMPIFVQGQDEPEEGIATNMLILALLGSFLTTVPPLLVIIPFGKVVTQKSSTILQQFLPFAAGTLSGTAVFLILPGAMEELHHSSLGESQRTMLWGTCILLGWMGSMALEGMAPHDHERRSVAVAQEPPANGDAAESGLKPFEVEQDTVAVPVRFAVAVPVLFSDFVHGIADGLVIGLAARACGQELLWAMVVATAGHEFPAELSAFAVLVHEANMPWVSAAVWNFLAAQGALIGAGIGVYLDVGAEIQATILALSGGVFLYLAFWELLPQAMKNKDKSAGGIGGIFVGFVLGALAMMAFAGHAHCSPEGGGGGEEGGDDHGHSHDHDHDHDH